MIELYAHQRAMLSLLRLNDGFALFAEQGTGKSFPVLFRLAELAERGRIGSALIVAPKAVCESWREKVALLDEGQQAALERIGLRVASYDMAWRRPELAQATFDAVVLDESHYVKTPTAWRCAPGRATATRSPARPPPTASSATCGASWLRWTRWWSGARCARRAWAGRATGHGSGPTPASTSTTSPSSTPTWPPSSGCCRR